VSFHRKGPCRLFFHHSFRSFHDWFILQNRGAVKPGTAFAFLDSWKQSARRPIKTPTSVNGLFGRVFRLPQANLPGRPGFVASRFQKAVEGGRQLRLNQETHLSRLPAPDEQVKGNEPSYLEFEDSRLDEQGTPTNVPGDFSANGAFFWR
jgi:hypothetical protein